MRLQHALVPEARMMSERSVEEWVHDKKRWVFKPVDGSGSRGVYRGDKVSAAKLHSLDPTTTLVQRLCPPGISPDDGTKYDLRE